jgi:pimeloyl-ACP methyl ester carboxylesterase
VEYTSYLPLLTGLADRGIDCYLVEMPFNLAFFGQNSADEIIDAGKYSHYFLAGHSLGGVVASSYVNSTNKSDGLILFAAYPTAKIEKPVLSIYGSEDKVLDMDAYNESKSLMANLTEFVIPGANHGQVGDYGVQAGDGVAKISSESQQNQSDERIVDFVDSLT